jgi:hypothetical protein
LYLLYLGPDGVSPWRKSLVFTVSQRLPQRFALFAAYQTKIALNGHNEPFITGRVGVQLAEINDTAGQ